jgi:FdhD protein
MNSSSEHEIVRMIKGRRETLPRQVVEEYPLRIRVNGCDLATLICSKGLPGL